MSIETKLDPTEWLRQHDQDCKRTNNKHLDTLISMCIEDENVNCQKNIVEEIEKSVGNVNSILNSLRESHDGKIEDEIESIPLLEVRKKVAEICKSRVFSDEISQEEIEDIEESLNKLKSNLADEVMERCTFMSLTIVLCAVAHFYSIWEDVLTAESISETSLEKFAHVTKLIQEIEEYLQELAELRMMNKDTIHATKRIATAHKISRRTSQLFLIYVKAKAELSKVEVKLNLISRPLDFFKECAEESSAVSNFKSAVQYLPEILFPYFAALKSLSGEGKAKNAINDTNTTVPVLTAEKLNEFRKGFLLIKEFIIVLEEIRRKANEAEQWYDDMQSI